MTTLVVTNDFPPRVGGIETFVRHVCGFLDDRVVVLTRTERDESATRTYDASLPFPVHRLPGPLLPTPSVARRAGGLLREYGAEQVVFGAAAPLGLLAGPLRTAGAHRILALTHGHEVWWSRVPGARPPHLVAVGEREDPVSSSRTERAREEAERRRGAEDDLLGAVLTEQPPRPARDRRRGQQRTRKAMDGERQTRVVRAGGGLVALCPGEHAHTC